MQVYHFTNALWIMLGSIYLLWLFYLASMVLIANARRKTLSKLAYVLGAPIILGGLVLDVLVNWFVASFIFMELPRQWLTTTRLKHHIKSSKGWRYSVAKYFCSKLLDTFDPSGCHCDD